ncbi:hypothetical protein [Paenibacillus sp. WLX2291]|uniref:hypothetical protein n=1 Tax=Paenibacillus sp. WLX2291 TaxID=3296934 RepID=UPI003983F872
MKKTTMVLILSTSMLLSGASLASAQSTTDSTDQATNSASNPIVLTPVSPSDFNGSINSGNVKGSVMSPLDTDGQNISYSFGHFTDYVRSSSPLPAHRYGTIRLQIAQTTNTDKNPANLTYVFQSTDAKLKSSNYVVSGNKNGDIITFTNVPKGTADKPIYLYIYNTNTSSTVRLSGNGHTLD